MHFVNVPMARAIGNSSGPNSTIAGNAFGIEPRITKATIRDRHEADGAAGHFGHRGGKIARKTRMRQRPGHGGRRADDDEDGAGQRRRVDQHRPQALPLDLLAEEHDADQRDERRVDDADGGDFGRGRHALDHGGADEEGRAMPGMAAKLSFIRSRPEARGVTRPFFVARLARHHTRPRGRREHDARQQTTGEQRRNRNAGDRTDGDEHEAGGMVSVIAPVADNSDEIAALSPRSFISGKSTGATAAMSAAFDPDMPDTRYMAPSST